MSFYYEIAELMTSGAHRRYKPGELYSSAPFRKHAPRPSECLACRAYFWCRNDLFKHLRESPTHVR
ncbi:hypothetical protein QKT49_gp013 [Acanthamoeba castellanii medusavirus]|uniref:Uncharacterized protein n=1 Tax=Acanthamoeba castellanii medusavirus J1 TaxID=3114988 RepID=A0A3T1CWE7_9VIRU|nr:hypothetical protein QKT49_gp013 [Acanthamoeba castellanii medusavirus]BBI30153.1 hypothetical protein [Acanthamoeba castellanii medusavirus J1]